MIQNNVVKIFCAPILVVALAGTGHALETKNEGVSTSKKAKKLRKKKKKIQKHKFKGSVESGLGYDSNPYQTPSSSYNEVQGDGSTTLITPQKIESGFFIPLSLKGDYEYRLKQNIRLLADIKAKAKYFTDSALKNAKEYKTDASVGVRFRVNKYKRETNNIDFKALVGNSYEIYVDHDDGELKTSVGGDQSDRYKYVKAGAEAAYTYEFKKLDIFLRARYVKRDYAQPDSWSALDHEYTRLKVQAGYQFNRAFHLGAYYEYRQRDYTERKSYEIATDGINIGLTGPAGVVYTYNDTKIFGTYRFNKAYTMDLNYIITQRKDDNQGYSDYLYHKVTMNNAYKISKALKASLTLSYYTYDYDNAYAYDQRTDVAEKRESDGYRFNLNTKYRLSSKWKAILDLHYREERSTDKRYEYDEMIAMASLKYRF